MLETLFGETIANAAGRAVPVRLIGEQHVLEDLGTIPSFADWARLIEPRPWMLRGQPDLNPREARGSREYVSLGEALVEAGLDHAALAAEAERRFPPDGGHATGFRTAARARTQQMSIGAGRFPKCCLADHLRQLPNPR